MGRAKINSPASGNAVRGDAWKAFGVTLLIHVVLFILLGLVLVNQAKFRTGQVVVSFGSEPEEPVDPSSSQSSRRNLIVSKGINHPPVEVPEPQVLLERFAIDSVAKIGTPQEIFYSDVSLEVPGNKSGTSEPVGASGAGEVAVPGWTGIRIGKDPASGLPRITGVIIGGPAHRQRALGISNEGDYIISVDGISTRHTSLEQIRDRIIGPADTIVLLGICRYPGAMVEAVKIRRGRSVMMRKM